MRIWDDYEYRKVWNALTSPVQTVLDDAGDNAANAQIRRWGDVWLYVDDSGGWDVLDDWHKSRLISL